MYRRFVSLVVVALLTVACSGARDTSQSDTPSVLQAGNGEPGTFDGADDNALGAEPMSDDEAADWYTQAICTANIFGPVRTALLEAAEVNQLNVPVLRTITPLYVQSLRDAQNELLNPPAPWPTDVADVVADRAALLDDSANLVSRLDEVGTPEGFLAWIDLLVADRDKASPLVDEIRFALAVSPDAPCPDVANPDVDAALLALEESRTATVTISCYGRGSSEDRDFFSLDEYYNAVAGDWNPSFCSSSVEGFTAVTPTAEQREAMDLYISRFKDGLDDEDAFSILVDNCIADPFDGFSDMTAAKATLMFCPQSPSANIIQQYAEGTRIDDDGSYVLGEEITHGTWRSTDSVSDCYWERSRPNGDTIANDFITFASGRVTVNIAASDGSFTTEGCGAWEKVQ